MGKYFNMCVRAFVRHTCVCFDGQRLAASLTVFVSLRAFDWQVARFARALLHESQQGKVNMAD